MPWNIFEYPICYYNFASQIRGYGDQCYELLIGALPFGVWHDKVSLIYERDGIMIGSWDRAI